MQLAKTLPKVRRPVALDMSTGQLWAVVLGGHLDCRGSTADRWRACDGGDGEQDACVLINCCGRGDKDMITVAKALGHEVDMSQVPALSPTSRHALSPI
eukprot:2740439-Rhodomonas_salina.1